MNKPVYLGFLILGLSKIVMFEFWYDYIKPKYGKKSKVVLCGYRQYHYTIKTDDIYKGIAEDVEIRFDT